jgi:hypothetical protein
LRPGRERMPLPRRLHVMLLGSPTLCSASPRLAFRYNMPVKDRRYIALTGERHMPVKDRPPG